jgi:hypothetical protein
VNFFQSQSHYVASKRHHFTRILFLLLFVAVLPVFVWAVMTQRIELRKYAVSPSPSPTPTETPTPTPSPTPTPTPVPNRLNSLPICASMYTDISSGTTLPLTVTFVCTGVDTDGYVNGIEFTFGDGTKQLIEQNIGGVGSITTTHTYTTIGSLGASCRVRDNNNVFSSTPLICKKNITIKPTPTVKVTPQSLPEKGAILTTPLLIATTSATPEASPSPTMIPAPYVQPEPSGKDNTRMWWIAGGIVALVTAFILLVRRRPPMPPTQSIPPMNPPTDASMPQNIEM